MKVWYERELSTSRSFSTGKGKGSGPRHGIRELDPSKGEAEDVYDSESAQLGDKRKVLTASVNGTHTSHNDERSNKRARFTESPASSTSAPALTASSSSVGGLNPSSSSSSISLTTSSPAIVPSTERFNGVQADYMDVDSSDSVDLEKDLEQWWSLLQPASESLIANGIPEIGFASSSSSSIPNSIAQTAKKKKRIKSLPPPSSSSSLPPKKRLKPHAGSKLKSKPSTPKPKALLTLMNKNIRTIKRIRHTHMRFAVLGIGNGSGGAAGAGNDDEPLESAVVGGHGGMGAGAGGYGDPMAMDVIVEDEDDRVDERPWEIPRVGLKARARAPSTVATTLQQGTAEAQLRVEGEGAGTERSEGKGKERKFSGIELGSRNADECVRWMNGKVLEHAGFQGVFWVFLGRRCARDVLGRVLPFSLLRAFSLIWYTRTSLCH